MEKSHFSKTACEQLIAPSSPAASDACSISSAASSHKTHHGGVQKFCSKIRHKIEDNIAPRLTSKLYKTSHKHSISMSSLSIVDSTSGKYTAMGKQSTLPTMPGNVGGAQATNAISTVSSAHRRLTGMLKHQRQRISKTTTKTFNKHEISAPIGEVATNTGIICPALNGKGVLAESVAPLELSTHSATSYESATYVDSDEEYQLSLNLTKQSLEDEIFEELERAAHDESKLNAVLKNVDLVLVDYKGGPVEAGEAQPHVICDVAVVEAAAAAQLELIALEPPNAFADHVDSSMEEGRRERDELIGCAVNAEEGKRVCELADLEAASNEYIDLQVELKTTVNNAALEVPTVCAAKVDKAAAISDTLFARAADATSTDSHSTAKAVPSATTVTTESTTPSQPPVRPKRLEKSKSSLAIPRRNVYQSPDTPTLRNIRSALATRALSKSVWELTTSNTSLPNSKIPIFKALPLQKRSKSFCSTSLTEVFDKDKLLSSGTTKMVAVKQVASNGSTAATNNQCRRPLTKDARTAPTLSLSGTKTRSRSASTTSTPQPQLAAQVQQQTTTAAQRTKRKSLPVEKLTRSNSRLHMERTKSSIGFNAKTANATTAIGPRITPSSGSLSVGGRSIGGNRSSIGSQGNGCSQSSASTISRSSTTTRKLHGSRDELLNKCLEKGHEILRKVESINTEGGSVRKTTTTIAKTSGKPIAALTMTKATAPTPVKCAVTTASKNSRTKVKTTTIGNATLPGKITKDACNSTTKSKAVATTKHLKYANEEKVIQPQLELCKIIPPVLGEMSDKHVELLVNVVQAKPVSTTSSAACKTTGAKQLFEHETIKNVAEHQQHTVQSTESESSSVTSLLANQLNSKVDHSNESDSDDSGHISNENDATIRTLSTSTASSVSFCESDITEEDKHVETLVNNKVVSQAPPAKSTKISELMEKFEKQSQASVVQAPSAVEQQAARATPTKVCTATRVAQLEPVQCIQTRVEFYPTYSKEVTIRLF